MSYVIVGVLVLACLVVATSMATGVSIIFMMIAFQNFEDEKQRIKDGIGNELLYEAIQSSLKKSLAFTFGFLAVSVAGFVGAILISARYMCP